MAEGASICTECSLYEGRRLDVVPPTLEGGIQSRQEVVHVSSKQSRPFRKSCRPAAHYQGQREHCPWQVLNGYLHNYEVGLLASIVLCKGVDESEDEGGGKDVVAENEARCGLYRVELVRSYSSPPCGRRQADNAGADNQETFDRNL